VSIAKLAAASLSGSSELSDDITDCLCIAMSVRSSLFNTVLESYFETLIALSNFTIYLISDPLQPIIKKLLVLLESFISFSDELLYPFWQTVSNHLR